ncbi:PQQ-binding-like beta-propeller repeat protein [Methanolobus sp. WCC1]|uniref:outer membrane protein assembly factor BamB family protein n=1 Tax=unclassified Methanolobus TaxID=2629569 RepID=UPI00324BCD61
MKKKIQNIIPIMAVVMLTLFFIPVGLAEESGSTTWHQFQKDMAHTGFYPESLPEAYDELWNVSVNAVGDSAPVVAEGMVFVNCADNKLKAIDEITGEVQWSTPVDPIQYGSWSSPAYHDGMVFTSTGLNTTCVYAENGTIKWAFKLPGNMASCNGGPLIADGKVFCNDWNDMHYYCLDEETGTELWNFTVDHESYSYSYAQGTPAYKDGKIYLTCWDYLATPGGHIYCVDATTGEKIWDQPFDSACGSAALGDDGRLYATAFNFYGSASVSALSMEDGSVIWTTNIGSTDSTPAIAYGNIYVSAPNNVYCINASNGSIIWNTKGAGGWTDSVSVADGKVFAGTQFSSTTTGGFTGLVELNAYTGDVLWKAAGGSTAISDGNIYTILRGGKVYAYSEATPTIDIVAGDLELPTGIAYPYYSNEITATISNAGNKYVDDVSVSLQVNGNEIDSQTISVLGGACSQSVSFDWTPIESGNYEITLVTSSDGITEISTTNNEMSIDVEVQSGNPDLVPSELSISTVYINQPYELTATVSNMGYMIADPFTVEVKEGTTVLASETISSLGPAQSTDVVFNWLPSATGSSDLTITVDVNSVVEEEDESNNELIQSIEVKPETSVEVLSDNDWSQFQRDSSNNGITTAYAPCDNSVKVKWSADDFDGCIDIPPIIKGNMVYVISSSGAVFAYDKTTGEYEDNTGWSKFTWESADLHSATPAYGDGNIFVATYGGNLYAYNSSEGDLLWTVNVTDDSFECPITYYDHRIYLGEGISLDSDTKYYYCYDDLGTLLWKYPITDTVGFIWNGASVIGDYVVFSTHEGGLISLDRKTGELADEISLNSTVSSEISFAKADPGVFRSSVMYNDGYVYTTSESGQPTGYVWKIMFDSTDGTFSDHGWCSEQIFSTSTPAVYDGKVYVGQGEHYNPGELICLDDSTGDEIWSYSVSGGVKSSPVVSTYYDTPYIYFTSANNNGTLYCLDGDGNLVWEYNPPDTGYILQGVAVSQGKAYFGTDGGYLYCVGGDQFPWNDPASTSEQQVSMVEAMTAISYWKSNYLIPQTNEKVSQNELMYIVSYWKSRYSLPLFW